jgi:uncharacterized protein with GYD domain
MPTYVSLMKLTDQGAKTIKSGPRRIEESIRQLEAVGGKVLGFYMVMGEYDYVSIAEAPSDEVAMTFMMRLSAAGNVRTTTLRAFTREQGVAMIKKLPRPSRKR